MAYRIHIFGASGSGTTTLGRALAERLDAIEIDPDAVARKIAAGERRDAAEPILPALHVEHAVAGLVEAGAQGGVVHGRGLCAAGSGLVWRCCHGLREVAGEAGWPASPPL